MALVVPFHPYPYPDEIMGSWLYRIETHSVSSIRNYAKNEFQKNIATAGWRDMMNENETFSSILKGLRVSYIDAMLNMTTYPYWLRFHSATDFSFRSYDNESTLPPLLVRKRRMVLPRLMPLLPHVKRTCPTCLEEDCKKYGEPYLHRSHQLPFVAVCHIHDDVLVSRCESCRVIFQMESTFTSTPLICSCGHDHRKGKYSRTLKHEAFAKLARFSAAALMSKTSIQECGVSFRFFDAELKNSKVIDRNDFREYLECIYGRLASKAMVTLSSQRADSYTFSAKLQSTISEYRATQICAFLSSRVSDFSEYQGELEAFTNLEVEVKKSEERYRLLPQIPQSVPEARDMALAFTRSNPEQKRSTVYRKFKSLYWYLMLNDRDWFDENIPTYPAFSTKTIPSIEEDRERIVEAIRNSPNSRVSKWSNLAQQEFFRATLRDSDWLEDRKNETYEEHKRDRTIQYEKSAKLVVKELKHAFDVMQTNVEKGVLVLPQDLPLYLTTLNQNQLDYYFRTNTEIRLYIQERGRKLFGDNKLNSFKARWR